MTRPDFSLQTRRSVLRLAGALGLVALPALQPVLAAAGAKLDPEALLKADTMPNVLAIVAPGVDAKKIPVSNHLLLEAPPIAVSGPLKLRLMSELPGTDLLLLFDTDPQAKQPSLLVAEIIEPGANADLSRKIELVRNTQLLLIARAAGQVYSVKATVLLAEKEQRGKR